MVHFTVIALPCSQDKGPGFVGLVDRRQKAVAFFLNITGPTPEVGRTVSDAGLAADTAAMAQHGGRDFGHQFFF